MQSITQTRLGASSHDAYTPDAMAALYGGRKLYARIAAEGGKGNSHKTAFCREHGISARLFNARAIELQSLIDSTREVLRDERKDLTEASAACCVSFRPPSETRRDSGGPAAPEAAARSEAAR